MATGNSIIKNEKVIIALILGAALIVYSLISRQTKLDTIRIENEAEEAAQTKAEEKESSKALKLDACLNQAEVNKWEQWSLNCESKGSNIKRDENNEIESCGLPTSLSDSIEAEAQKEKDRCAELYK